MLFGRFGCAYLRRRPWDFDLYQFLAVSANGENVDYEVRLPGTVGGANVDDGSDGTGDFYTFNIRNIPVIEGLNTITFTVTEKSGGQCPHFDKIDIISSAAVSEYMHRCDSKCEVCGKCTDYECEDEISCGVKCECVTLTLEGESEDVIIVQAAEPMYGGVTQVQPTDGNPGYVRIENDNQGASFTFTFEAAAAGSVNFAVYVTPSSYDYYLHDIIDVCVNDGDPITGTPIIREDPDLEDNHWADTYVRLDLGAIEIYAGENTISFTTKGYSGIKVDKIELKGDVLAADVT